MLFEKLKPLLNLDRGISVLLSRKQLCCWLFNAFVNAEKVITAFDSTDWDLTGLKHFVFWWIAAVACNLCNYCLALFLISLRYQSCVW